MENFEKIKNNQDEDIREAIQAEKNKGNRHLKEVDLDLVDSEEIDLWREIRDSESMDNEQYDKFSNKVNELAIKEGKNKTNSIVPLLATELAEKYVEFNNLEDDTQQAA